MPYGLSLAAVIFLGVIGFFTVSFLEKPKKDAENLSEGYEIIEDNG